MHHDTSIFISAICNFWRQLQILGGLLTPSPDPAFPSPSVAIAYKQRLDSGASP